MTVSVKQYIASLQPEWTFDDWMAWPPDVFALTSLLLKHTGTYMLTILPPGDEVWPLDDKRKEKLAQARAAWYAWMFDIDGEKPEILASCQEAIENVWDRVTLEHLHALLEVSDRPDLPPNFKWDDAWKLCSALLDLHGLADEVCAGFGIPSGDNWAKDTDQKLIHCVANMLLAHTGSLARLPVHTARVLPKLRTPVTGMTLRSLSHHLTMHQTEVDVRWRSMPLVNIDENTINILIVPWPYRIEPNSFRPSSYSTQRNSDETTRYFHYTGIHDDFPPEKLLSMIKDAERSVSRVHMIVFPELALTRSNLDELLDALAKEKSRDAIPIVLAGIRSENNHPNGSLAENKVVLSTFYAGKWYHMEQYKHHRWKLDGDQIRQYNLGGVLTSSKDWWEAIKLSSRRLSVLAPNNWFALCPLICEDLARLEPVSELIRGIGPTLLIAILLDGPQLQPRWPGRYASIMADDPGSSVLTVSSLGLTKRSPNPAHPGPNDGSTRTVALWKDQQRGYLEIKVDGVDEELFPGVVLTITANWREELSADGRSDNVSAALFVYQGTHQVVGGLKSTAPAEHRERHERSETSRLESIAPRASNESEANNGKGRQPILSERYDFLEITLFSYFLDAALEAPVQVIETLRDCLLGDDSKGVKIDFRARNDLFSKIRYHNTKLELNKGQDDPDKHQRDKDDPDKDQRDKHYRESIGPFIPWICQFLEHLYKREDEKETDYFRRMKEDINEILTTIYGDKGVSEFIKNWTADQPFQGISAHLTFLNDIRPQLLDDKKHREVRFLIYGCLAILWAIHGRLAAKRHQGKLNREGTRLLSEIEELLKKKYDEKWIEARSYVHSEQSGASEPDGMNGREEYP